jgi:hypothetical protein
VPKGKDQRRLVLAALAMAEGQPRRMSDMMYYDMRLLLRRFLVSLVPFYKNPKSLEITRYGGARITTHIE